MLGPRSRRGDRPCIQLFLLSRCFSNINSLIKSNKESFFGSFLSLFSDSYPGIVIALYIHICALL
ncbi:hypothetical protein SSAG_06961 [Streptomyces sp. Mg1]|nr:hypothetical protein SSAG_06961 [Streptomyces sp. Mg1]